MFINPLTIIENGWLKFPEWMDDDFKQKCIQPNAIDITLDKVFGLKNDSFYLSETNKQMRRVTEHKPSNNPYDPHLPSFHIPTGCVDIMSDFFITVPVEMAAVLIVRSTLNRNGLFVTSGLYDTAFSGNIGFMLHNRGPVAYIAPHTRIAQIAFVESDNHGEYAGGYNTPSGKHWSQIHNDIIGGN